MKIFTLIVGGLFILSVLLGIIFLLTTQIVDKIKELRNEQHKQFMVQHFLELRDWCSSYWPIVGDVANRALESLGNTGYTDIRQFRQDLRRKYPNEKTGDIYV